MAPARLAAIPFEHVEAELAAFPIASEASFRSPHVFLDPVTHRQKELWRAAERDVLASIPAVPLDEFVAIRDRLWFGETPDLNGARSGISLVDYLRRLPEQYLDRQGRPVDRSLPFAEKEVPSPQARLRWNWLCRALPPDLLRTAHGIGTADGSPFPLSPSVGRLLRDNGFAETHLHLGAAPDFSLLWANLMHTLAVKEVPEKSLASPGACFDEGEDFAKWILWAAVARLVLAERLYGDTRTRNSTGLLDFTSTPWYRRMDASMRNDLCRLMSELERGREGSLPLGFARGRAVYRSLIRPLPFLWNRQEERQGLRARHRPRCLQDVFANDPLAHVVGCDRTSVSSPETLFVGESLRYMERHNTDDEYARLFWQVIRVRCLLYRHLVQRPLTPGLQWFVRFFSRIKPVRRSLPPAVLMQAAMRRSDVGEGLRSLEVRLGTKERASECRDRIEAVNNTRSSAAVEVGAVFHFSRDRGGGWKKGHPNAYGLDRSYPGVPPDTRLRTCPDVGNPSGFRFARFYLKQRRHAQALVSVLRDFPCALHTFRGLDLCTDEAGVPIWVMAPLIRWVREAGQAAAIHLRDRGIANLPPLSTTVHAGEDFVHLRTGLRRLHEAIRHLGLEEGDRIGHGIALGLDPSTWFEQTGRVIQPLEERLFDLVWEWEFYAVRGINVGSGRIGYITRTIARLTKRMFDEAHTPEDLVQFVHALHDEQQLKARGFPDKSRRQNSRVNSGGDHEHRPHHLLVKYLRSTEVWRQGRTLETITLSDQPHELEALHNLQSALRKEVGTRGLTVEVNPSSNLLIGNGGRLKDHPIWRLRPVHAIDQIPPLSVCIGSDDPLTFATTLPQEYQLLFDAIVLAGQSHDVAIDWLDNARETGMRARFTLPGAITGRPTRLKPSQPQGRPPAPPP